MKQVSISVGALMAAMMLSPAAAQDVAAQGLKKLSIVVFGSPSLGAFLPPVIKAQKLDEKNGLSITFEERTPDAYTAQFNSGEFQLGGSAALLTVGLADIRGVKVTYLFNLFDFWGTVVTSRPEVNSLRDIEGKDLAAAKGTTNYVIRENSPSSTPRRPVSSATRSPTARPPSRSGSPPTPRCTRRSPASRCST